MTEISFNTSLQPMTISTLQDINPGMKFGDDFIVYDNLSPLKHFSETVTFDFGGVIFLFSGSVSVEINGDPVEVSQEEFVLFRRGDEWNGVKVSEDCTGWFFGSNVSLILENKEYTGFSRLASVFGRERRFSSLNTTLSEMIQMYGNILREKFNHGIIDVRLTLAALINDILICSTIALPTTRTGRNPAAKVFKMFTTLLAESNPKPRSVKWYAETLSVTPGYLTRLSKKISGKTITEWIDEAIMADIRRMLRHSENSVKEIALKIGFSNEAFFCKYVKAHTCMTPLQYRRYLQKSFVELD